MQMSETGDRSIGMTIGYGQVKKSIIHRIFLYFLQFSTSIDARMLL